MKKFTGLLIILTVLIIGGYYGMGILTERTIKKNIQVIDQANGLYAEIDQYHRGLFTSEAKIKWHLHLPERVVKDENGNPQVLPAHDYDTAMPLKVYHGPIIFYPNLRFGFGYAEAILPLPQEYKNQFENQFTDESIKPELNLSIFINYLDESTLDAKIPKFNLKAKDSSGTLNWLGLDASTKLTAGLKKVKGQIVLSGLDATKDDSKVNLGKVSSDYDLHDTPAGLYLGDANFYLSSFDVSLKDQKIFSLKNFAVKTYSDIEEHLFNTHFNLSIQSILSNNQNYGPGELEISLRNIDADILAKINQQTNAIQNGDELQRQQAMLSLLPELPKLFIKGAEFEISKLSLKIPQGLIEGNLNLSLPKGENANPFELAQRLQGKAKLQVPAETLKQLLQYMALQQLAKQPNGQQASTLQNQKDQQTSSSKQNENLPKSNAEGVQPAGQNTQTQGQSSTQQQASTSNIEQLALIQAEKQINNFKQTGFIITQDSNYIIEINLDKGKLTVNGKPFDFSMIKF